MPDVFEIKSIDERVLGSERSRVLHCLQRIVPHAYVVEIGSTAVEGLLGKNDLDFMVRVPPSLFAEVRKIFDEALSRNVSQFSDEQFQGYCVHSEYLDVSVQLVVGGCQHDHFEDFILALKSSEELRRSYNELKLTWSGRCMNAYREAKRSFISSVLSR